MRITMRILTTHAAALALAGALAVTAATPSFAKQQHPASVNTNAGYQPPEQDVYGPAPGAFKPGFTGYGRQAYNPEQPTDPDPRIGGQLKMSTDR